MGVLLRHTFHLGAFEYGTSDDEDLNGEWLGDLWV